MHPHHPASGGAIAVAQQQYVEPEASYADESRFTIELLMLHGLGAYGGRPRFA
jgi:hypothetical protein